MIDQETIEELVTLRGDARMSAESFTEAIAAQSEKHGISKSALRRYICAVEADKVANLDAESSDIATLLEATQ